MTARFNEPSGEASAQEHHAPPSASGPEAAKQSPEAAKQSPEAAKQSPEAARQNVMQAPGVDATEQRVSDMLDEGGGVVAPRVIEGDPAPESPPLDFDPRSEPSAVSSRAVAWLERFAQRWALAHLRTLVRRRGRLTRSLDRLPRQMHQVAHQTELVLELVDDFRTGTYRQVSWRSVALLVFGLLYTASPADVIPDALPLIGQLDDLSVLAIVTRAARTDLRAYCRFKGYPEAKYFRAV